MHLFRFFSSLLVFSLVAFPSLTFGTAITQVPISIIAHEASALDEDKKFVIHVTNLTPNPLTFERIELVFLEEISESAFVQQDHRQNILSSCSENPLGSITQITLKPWERRDFYWDGKSDDCTPSTPGRYAVQIVDSCESEGCLGSYYITTGEHFTLE